MAQWYGCTLTAVTRIVEAGRGGVLLLAAGEIDIHSRLLIDLG
jgi:hypothetical protein